MVMYKISGVQDGGGIPVQNFTHAFAFLHLKTYEPLPMIHSHLLFIFSFACAWGTEATVIKRKPGLHLLM